MAGRLLALPKLPKFSRVRWLKARARRLADSAVPKRFQLGNFMRSRREAAALKERALFSTSLSVENEKRSYSSPSRLLGIGVLPSHLPAPGERGKRRKGGSGNAGRRNGSGSSASASAALRRKNPHRQRCCRCGLQSAGALTFSFSKQKILGKSTGSTPGEGLEHLPF